uniref:Zmp:0000001103 n=1 Tax=Cyprinus carpio carpio TaxID=630221 RepID=A0A8C1DBT1_CYPCA
CRSNIRKKNIQSLHSLNALDCKSSEMSDDIYDDVIRTESERVEMKVAIYESADCVRDHNFLPETNKHRPLQQTGCDCVKNRSSRAAAVCLVLMCVLLLTAVIVLCVHIHTKNTNYTKETQQLLTKITNLTEERDQLLTKNINLTNERDGLSTKNDNLTKQTQQFNQERNELVKSLHETDGWSYYNLSLYFISSEWKSWTESRRYCKERGADLIIINNREEQVSERVGTAVWIGLTDSDEEGRWKWVGGSNMISSFSFWWSGEPSGYRGKNCAVSYPSGWYDNQCNTANKWICEKSFVKYHIP